jgi:hypothetical protein
MATKAMSAGNPMPRQNRVTPFGEIIATPERGTLMGNRGIIHDPDGRIRRNWLLKRWLLCVLEFRGRRRIVMAPNRYTELFFLDEATGLAAGHRPCAECQHKRYIAYRDAWKVGNSNIRKSERPGADEMDDRLHAERLDQSRSKRTYLAKLNDLPDGVFVTRNAQTKQALLVQGDSLLAWSPAGYSERLRRRNDEVVSVLTPQSTIAAIQAGFVPRVHPSAGLA